MDSYCIGCGEPWDVNYLLHDVLEPEVEGFAFGRHRLVVKACPCCRANSSSKPSRHFRDCANVLSEVLGDDLDGFAAEMEDLAAIGLFKEELEHD